MRVGIDASNLRTGGGLTHLIELLRGPDPREHGVEQVIVWSGVATLSQIEDRPWLVKIAEPLLERSVLHRAFWQRFRLSNLARSARCDVLLVPGGSYAGDFRPAVTMSRNMLPFEPEELRRYGLSRMTLRLTLLRSTLARSFRRADGLIFLTAYARDVVGRAVRPLTGKVRIIPHGVNEAFAQSPREQHAIECYSTERPFRIVYVSIIDVYKHQSEVVEAVAALRASGLPVALDLVGPAYAPALARVQATMRRVDPASEFVRYVGPVPNSELHSWYAAADACVFASSCENMPNILLEGMASALPIACSNRGPMPEMLGDAGVYFDPENSQDIARALRQLIESTTMRAELARAASSRAAEFSWTRCAADTFAFLEEVSNAHSDVRLMPMAG